MTAFDELARLAPIPVWDGIAARVIEGERCTLAVIELGPGTVVPEHAHDNEQVGFCIAGSMRFRIGGEEQVVRAGSTWSIPPNVSHEVRVGDEGCVVAEVFVPGRADWAEREREEPRAPRWP